MTYRRRTTGALAAAATALALGGCGAGAAAAPGPTTVNVTIHHSKFSPATLHLRPGSTIRLVVVNTDPIEHELIAGDEAVQQQHEVGTDRLHEGPGAVSVPAGATRSTVYTVPRATAPLFYGCHLPGHWAYGMKGTIVLKTSG